MKTKAMKKILSMLLVCVMLVGALAGFNVFAAGEATIEIVSNNVWYGEALYPMYAVETTGDIAGYEIEVEVTVNEKTYTCIEVKDDPKYGTCYVAPVGVAAQNINTVYEATPYLKDNGEVVAKGDTQTYSVLEYLYERLYVSNDTTDAQKTMYNALINYAVAADAVINEKTPNDIGSYYYVNFDANVTATVDDEPVTTGIFKVGTTINLSTDLVADANKKVVFSVKDPVSELKLDELAVDEDYIVMNKPVIIVAETVDDVVIENASLSFANVAVRVSQNSDQQIWEQNGITFTNNKASSSTPVANYSNPVRLYANSEIIVAFPNMKTIVFNCNSTTYATALNTSITNAEISGATVEVSGKVVTVTLSEAADSFTVPKLSAQIRIDSIDVSIH